MDNSITQSDFHLTQSSQTKNKHKSYLEQFSKYIKNKLGEDQHEKSEKNDKSRESKASMQLANHLQRRKLVDNSSQQRFNRMMNQFRSLDTYIDVKGFIQDLNGLNTEQQQQQQCVLPDKTQQSMCQAVDTPYRSLLDKVNLYYSPRINRNILQSTSKLDSLLRTMHGATRYSTKRLDQKNDTDLFQTNLYSKLFQQQPEVECSKDFLQKAASPIEKRLSMLYRKKEENATGKVVNQKYYKEFKQKAQDIEAKLHHMLEVMHLQKWQVKKRHDRQNLETMPAEVQKPVLDSKFRAFAPKNIFRFREDHSCKKNSKGEKRKSSDNQKGEKDKEKEKDKKQNKEDRENTINNSAMANSAVNNPPKHSLNKTHTTNFNQLSKKTRTRKIKHNPCQSRSLQTADLKRVKDTYSFKKPLIKETILRRIVDFIGVVQNSQFKIRKQNSEIINGIAKLEHNKQNDFDRFLDEKLMITAEEMKTFTTKKGDRRQMLN